MGESRSGKGCEAGPVLKGVGDNIQECVEGLKVLVVDCGTQGGLDEVIARDKERVDGAHACDPFERWLELEPFSPSSGPRVEGCRLSEKNTDGFVALRAVNSFTQKPEGQGKVSLVRGHAPKKVFDQGKYRPPAR